MWSKWGMLMLVLISISSCKINKTGVVLENRNARDLMACVNDSKIEPEWFSAKIATDLKAKGEKNSFKVSLRIRKDSIIWVNIGKGPIIVATSIITPDSIKAVVKLGDQFYIEKDFDFIKRQFDLNLDFDALQNLLIGNPLAFNPEDKYKTLDGDINYVLSTHNQRQIDKFSAKLPKKKEDQLIKRFWIRHEDCRVVKTLINQLSDTSNINIEYKNFKKEDNFVVPNKVSLNADTPRDSVVLELNYSRYKINKPLKFTYKVNNKYPKIDPENRVPGDLDQNRKSN